MAKRDKLDPNSQGYTNALLESMEDKMQAIFESTAPISPMQKQIDQISQWKEKIDLIPVIFEEVGALRQEIEIIKAAMKLLDRHDQKLEKIERRLVAIEERVNS